jgi:arylsulfatase A-like enzyme
MVKGYLLYLNMGNQLMGKKNILFIFTDQMHRYALGCMGNPDIETPNLDRLAENGVLFTNAYSNCPLCTPFRINLLTGLYSHQTHSLLNNKRIPKDCITLAHEFNMAGYHTSYVGKWHIGATGNQPIPQELRAGFTDFIGYQCYNEFIENVCFYDEENQEHRYNKHRTDVTTDIALERLEKIKDKPFFMCVSYQAPHYPVQPKVEFEEKYRGKPIHRRANAQEIDPYTRTHSPPSPFPKENCPNYQKYGGNLDEYIRLYYGMVSQVDDNVGRLLNALEKWGIRDNTIVIFTSDHGDMQGSHGLKNKQLAFEESSGIPLIVQVPNGVKGAVSDALISGIDFYPTTLSLVDSKPSITLPGKDLSPILYGKKLTNEPPVFSENWRWKMIREGDFKLVVRGFWNKPTELYNVKNDTYEMANLIKNPEYAVKIKELRNKIQDWLKQTKPVKK